MVPPLLIVAGFLGSGKTTLLQRALARLDSSLGSLWHNGKLLVLVNDFASENVDADLLRQPPNVGDRPSSRDVVDLSGGCVCCNLLPALLSKLQEAVTSQLPPEYIVLELTGLADPVPVAGAILNDPILSRGLVIDAIVCVVDAATYSLAHDPLGGSQLVGANVVVLNKWSRAEEVVDSSALEALDPALRRATSNPSLRVYRCDYSNVALDELIANRGLFAKHNSAATILARYAPPSPLLVGESSSGELAREMETIGAKCVVYRAPLLNSCRAPKLSQILELVQSRLCTASFGVWRSKGFFFAVDDVGVDSAEAAKTTRQFRWSSVRLMFEYNEVLPPLVESEFVAMIVFIGRFDEALLKEELHHVFPF